MKLKDACRNLTNEFRKAKLQTPELDARVLLAALSGESQTQISFSDKDLGPAEQEKFLDYRARRMNREPVARIIGRRGFWTLDLELSPATLEPRPDSETVVELALEHLSARRDDQMNFLDLGTGTGALLLALLHEFKDAQGTGIDLSNEAVQTATRNAQANNLGTRAQFICSDWFQNVQGKFDLIVSNPPYIPSAVLQKLEPEVRRFDPALALDGGADGLDAYRSIVVQAGAFLKENGLLVLEVGHDQSAAVTTLFGASGYRHIATKCDLAGHQRALVFSA